MSARDTLRNLLEVCGSRHTAKVLGCDRRLVQRWATGEKEIGPDSARCIEALYKARLREKLGRKLA